MKDYKPVKTGIIGCGGISEIFFQNFTERFQIIEPVKCADVAMEAAKAKEQKYHVPAVSVDEIINDDEIELVVNLTPAEAHYKIIEDALNKGKNVYTEKVITPKFDDAKRLKQLAEEKGLLFGCEPDHFMGSSWQCAREYIDGGIIGEVTSVSVSISQNIGAVAERLRFVNNPGGGCGYDFGIYAITQLISLLGPAVEVNGIMMRQRPNRIHKEINHPDFGEEFVYANEDIASASILFESGAIATLHLTGNSILEGPQSFVIYGTAGALSMPLPALFSGDMKLYRSGSFESTEVLSAFGFDHDSRGVGAADLAWALRLGRKPRADVSIGLHGLEILSGIEESFKTKKAYTLTTSCEKPKVLDKGYRGLPGFCFGEEGSLIF